MDFLNIQPTQNNALNYTNLELLTQMGFALLLGILLGITYKITTKNDNYSQSFNLTIVFSAVIFSVVMLIVGTSLTRAFALVGAFSIIRFQTMVKDTRDMIFIFSSLVVGMAVGVGHHSLALISSLFISLMMLVFYRVDFGCEQESKEHSLTVVPNQSEQLPAVEEGKVRLSLVQSRNEHKRNQ